MSKTEKKQGRKKQQQAGNHQMAVFCTGTDNVFCSARSFRDRGGNDRSGCFRHGIFRHMQPGADESHMRGNSIGYK